MTALLAALSCALLPERGGIELEVELAAPADAATRAEARAALERRAQARRGELLDLPGGGFALRIPGSRAPADVAPLLAPCRLEVLRVDEEATAAWSEGEPLPAGHAALRDQGEALLAWSDPALGPRHVEAASLARDELSGPALALTFTDEGALAFADVTRASVGRRLALVLDGEVLAAPRVMEPIPGGSARLTFPPGTSPERAAALAECVDAGALPVGVRLVSERTWAR